MKYPHTLSLILNFGLRVELKQLLIAASLSSGEAKEGDVFILTTPMRDGPPADVEIRNVKASEGKRKRKKEIPLIKLN